MCGICGVIDWTAAGEAAAIVRRMTPTMHHRGPDDEGIADFGFRNSEFEQSAKAKELSAKSYGALSIGMTRLSIIDVEGGHQPVFNEDEKVGAVLNGEIYNFQELRRQLKDRG